MFPVLLELGPLKLYSYGLMMFFGFLSAIYWSQYRAKRKNLSAQFVSDLAVAIVISGVLGGRITYFLVNGDFSGLFSFEFFQVWNGGMVFYGGFILAVATSIWFCRKRKVEFWRAADVLMPTVALGHFFGRLGCICAGCCYGAPTDLPWAFTFTNESGLAPLNIPLHPTQLYEALGNLVVIGLILLAERRQKFVGQSALLYLALYAILRFSVEQFRGDVIRGFVTFGGIFPNEWLSTSMFISLVMLAVAIGFSAFLWKRSRQAK